MDLAAAQQHFTPEPGWLNTASYGLPPTTAWTEMQDAMEVWRHGSASWEPWGESTERARRAYAQLVGAAVTDVTVGAQASQLLGQIAASVPPGTTVLAAAEEFTSNLFPWLAQQQRGVIVHTASAAELAEHIRDDTDVVAFSLVQSASGAIADIDAITAAASAVGAVTAVDLTQAAGWLPVQATRFDITVCSGYKWLLAPRGASFLTTTPQVRAWMRPDQAGWYAGADVHSSYYGPPLRLAEDARRFDISPAWFSWIGAAPALELLIEVGVAAVHDHDVALADRFLTGLRLPPEGSAIVSVDIENAADRLSAAGIRAAARGGRVRASFHLYTTEDDVDRAVAALLA